MGDQTKDLTKRTTTLESPAANAVLRSFARAAQEVPAYRDLIAGHGVEAAQVTSLAAFAERVPLLDKQSYFAKFPFPQLCVGGTLDEVCSILPSSGRSQAFAFGVTTAAELEAAREGVDATLEWAFNCRSRSTLILNTYPMGVGIPTAVTTLNTGANADIALAAVKNLAVHFEQLLLLGQPLFVKHLLELGVGAQIDWAQRNASVIVGGESTPETWRTYVGTLLGLSASSDSRRLVASSYGLAEMGLNVFQETPDTIALVRTAHHHPAFRDALFARPCSYTPHLFVWDPTRTFVETVDIMDEPQLVLSTLQAVKLPLLRYCTGDSGYVLTASHLRQVCSAFAIPYRPALEGPCVVVFGRADSLSLAGSAVREEELKEALYATPALAGAVTGYFKARASANEGLSVEVQLQPGAAVETTAKQLEDALRARLDSRVRLKIRALPFDAFGYPTTFERKFKYLG